MRNYLLRAKVGDKVKVHYRARLKDGSLFGSSGEHAPVSFLLGEGALIPGFEQAVLGMAAGEKKTVNLTPEDGYGLPRGDLRIVSSRASVERDVRLQVGMVLSGQTRGSGRVPLRVADQSESTVTLDGNHPLAGRHLVFELELVEIVGVDRAAST
ncbi:MAG: FKBP-type peptidyl-prolyl cis-trans isomerase [Vicinamibacteria bacterium]